MDDWHRLQQEEINLGKTLPPISFQVFPPAQHPEHVHSQVTQSAMRNPPVQSQGFRRMLEML